MSASHWRPILDSASGKYYYHHAITQEVTWNRPAELDQQPTSITHGTNIASPPTEAAPPSTTSEMPGVIDIPGCQWSKVWDTATGQYYYANKDTFAVDWNVPAEVLALQLSGTSISDSAPLASTSSPSTVPAAAVASSASLTQSAPIAASQASPSPHTSASPSPSSSPSTTATHTPHSSPPARKFSINTYSQPSQDFGITHEFDRVLDSASGNYYYVHKETRDVQWAVPPSWREVQDLEKKQLQQRGSLYSTAPPGSLESAIARGHAPSKSNPDEAAAFAASLHQSSNIPPRPATMRASAVPPPLPRAVTSASNSATHSRRTSYSANHDGMIDTAPVATPLSEDDTSSASASAPPPRKISVTARSGPPPLPMSPMSKGPPALPVGYHDHRPSVNSLSGVGSLYPQSPSSTLGSPMMSPASTPKVGPPPPPPNTTKQGGPSPSSTASSSSSSSSSSSRPLTGVDGKPTLATAIKNDIHQFSLKGFASNHFRTFNKKTGFLSRAVTVDLGEVLSFQRTPIHKSLLTASKKYSSDAVSLFKKILSFMGDSPEASRKNPQVLAAEIVSVGVKIAPLRDELFCQLAKQTKLNPEPLSCALGWRLMVLACSSFPPSRNFQDHLIKYFAENHEVTQPQEAGILSRYCSWKLNKTIREGGDEKMTLAMVEEMGRTGVRSWSVLFPGDLEYIAYCQNFEKNPVSRIVPEIMVQCCNIIRESGGFQAKGIFRIAAQREHTIQARAKIESGRFDQLDRTDCHTHADIMKHWLRELAIPLIPMKMYDACLKACDNEAECEALVMRELQSLPAHMATLDYLMNFLADLATHQKVTMMNEENLAIVFSQDILRTEEKDPVVLYKNSPREKNFVRQLICIWGKRREAQGLNAQ